MHNSLLLRQMVTLYHYTPPKRNPPHSTLSSHYSCVIPLSPPLPPVAPRTALEVEQYGDTKLPDSVLVHVMVCLAKTREPGGLRGFACVAKDLANASLVGVEGVLGAGVGWGGGVGGV